MTLRDDLIPVIDFGRQLAADLGLRRHSVTVRLVTWSGEPGDGAPTNTDLVLSPPPKVDDRPERIRWSAPGQVEEGDRLVSRISATYTREQLGGVPQDGEDWRWILTDESGSVEYVAASVAEQKSFGWKVYLRRRGGVGRELP